MSAPSPAMVFVPLFCGVLWGGVLVALRASVALFPPRCDRFEQAKKKVQLLCRLVDLPRSGCEDSVAILAQVLF